MKLKTSQKIVIIILVLFAIGTIALFYYRNTKTYPSLNKAIEEVGLGGKEVESYDFSNGTFIFYEDGPIEYEYFYVENKIWYNKGLIYEKKYYIKDLYEVTLYYLPRNEISFIRVDTNEPLTTLKDSLGTEFTTLQINKKTFYFAGVQGRIPDQYILNINEEQYLVKEYNSLFKLYQ